MTIEPADIIETFERCVMVVWGARREYENRHDEDTAKEWIERGADLVTVAITCMMQFDQMEKKGMKAPKSLNIIDGDITGTMNRESGNVIDVWELQLSRWTARVANWKEHPEWWLDEMWGPRPNEKGCRAPQDILKAHGIIK